jgi:hypothetical protein
MPTPTPTLKLKLTIEEIGEQFYQLRRFDTVSSEGYHYRIDFDKYDADLNHARHCFNLAKMDFECGLLTDEEFEEENKMYLFTISKYHLVDEDGKICGEYFSDTRSYKLFYWRIMVNGSVYYRDENMAVFTYSACYVGQLYVGNNMELEIIDDVVSVDDDDSV